MFAYLWVMFFLLQLHQYLILAQRHIPFEQYGVGFINALVLAKVMLVADDLRLGEWRGRRRLPLIYPVLTRSALFAVVFIVFVIIEKMLLGVLRGKLLPTASNCSGAEELLGGLLVANHRRLVPCSFFRLRRGSRLMEPGELAKILFTRGPRPADADIGQRYVSSFSRSLPDRNVETHSLRSGRLWQSDLRLLSCQ